MRETVLSPLRIAGAATRVAMSDLRAVHSPLSWTVGWLGRVLAQVCVGHGLMHFGEIELARTLLGAGAVYGV